MDMDGMQMGGGMDMGGSSMFQVTNKQTAKRFWYFVAAVVAVYAFKRCCDVLRTAYAKRRNKSRSDVPSRPSNFAYQVYDTTTALGREMTYLQFRPFTGAFSRYFSTLPMGPSLLLLAYWTMILVMLWSNVILPSTSSLYGFKWEIVGFRAAWVSVIQLPLIYCLGGKANIISLITGISYERLNWLHRWVGRTIFLTVIVHWSYFFREWWLADFVKDELNLMPMVKYGFGAWAVIGWSVVTGFGFFRVKCYELWVLQHLATAGVLLWLLYVHVPSYARYNIWLSIGFVAFDRIIRGAWSLAYNLHMGTFWKRVASNHALLGFNAEATSHEDGYMTLTIADVDFSWQPGQHVFISMPTCGIFQSHPFTISNGANLQHKSLQLYFKCHSGFTERLRKQTEAGKAESIRTFISGPWGNPPLSKIERCNSLIFIASSTGAAFNAPLLEHAVQQAKFVQRISFHWIIRHESQLAVFMPRIMSALESARQLKIETEFKIFITADSRDTSSESLQAVEKDSHASDSSVSKTVSEDTIDPLESQARSILGKKKAITTAYSIKSSTGTALSISSSLPISFPGILISQGRPQSWDDIIHPVLVESWGETAIVACGGRALIADIRNYVAFISDERAVLKGTGAQGIFLFTETYGW